MDRKASPVLGKKGLTYKGEIYDYPIKIGKLKTYKSVFKNVTLELIRKGNNFYLNFYDTKKGLIGYGRIHKVDAYNLIRSGLAKTGYDSNRELSSDDFRRKVTGLDMIFIDQ